MIEFKKLKTILANSLINVHIYIYIYILSVYSKFSDRVVLPGVNHMLGMQYQIVLNITI